MSRGNARIVGVDVARSVALLGMVAAHLLYRSPPGSAEPGPWVQLVGGRSSALFALIAGVSLVLASTRAGTWRPAARYAIVIRSAFIAAIGLVLGLLNVGVAIILVYYAVLFLCAVPVLHWRARSLAWLAAGWGLAAPVASMMLRPMSDPSRENPVPTSLLDPVGLTTELVITGYYPVLTWATYLFAGMAVAKLDLRSPVVAGRLLAVGTVVALAALAGSALVLSRPALEGELIQTYVGSANPATGAELRAEIARGFFGTTPTDSWWWLGVWSPHSGSIVDLAHTTGCALAVLALALLLTGQVSAVTTRGLAIVFGAGSMSLTLYVLHVLLLAVLDVEALPDIGPVSALGLHVLTLTVIGAVFGWLRRPGPLEMLVGELTRWGTDTLGRRPAPTRLK